MNGKIQQLEAALAALNATPAVDPSRQLDLLNELVREYRPFDPQRAFALSETAHELSLRLDYPAGRLDSLRNLTVLNTHISPNYAVALTWANQALDLLARYPDPATHAYILQCMQAIYRHLGDHPTAHAYLMQALTLSRQIGDQPLEGLLYNDLGVLYRFTHDYEPGLQAYQQAMAIAQAMGDQQQVALALNNIGDLLNLWGRPTEALPYLEESLVLTQQLGLKILEPSVLDSLSEIYVGQGKYAAALACLAQAQQIIEEFDNQFELATCLRNIARVYQHQQLWAQALDYLHRALAVAKAISLKIELVTCHQLLAEIYEAQGKPAQALGHYKAFHTINAEIYNEQATQKLKTLQVIHETEKAKREAEIYRLKNVELQAALEKVKQLSGLLPICSSCKKIRDDGGYWQDVAVYIRDHSEAEFSHAICPDCMATLYPQYHKKTVAKQAV